MKERDENRGEEEVKEEEQEWRGRKRKERDGVKEGREGTGGRVEELRMKEKGEKGEGSGRRMGRRR